ncbi:MAG: FtsB family cell division protein [Candidatus Komeilibacteria bacterium]
MSQGGIKSFYYSKYFLLIIFVIIIFFLFSAVKDYYSQEDLREDISTLDSQINDLQAQQTDLIATLAQVQSEDFVETEARTRLNLRKPGEKVIIVSSDEDVQRLNDQAGDKGIKDLLEEPDTNSSKWWSYFFPDF